MDFHNSRRTSRGDGVGVPGSAEPICKGNKNRKLSILDCISYIGTYNQRISLNGDAKKSKKKRWLCFFLDLILDCGLLPRRTKKNPLQLKIEP